jgi:hypothetical protein
MMLSITRLVRPAIVLAAGLALTPLASAQEAENSEWSLLEAVGLKSRFEESRLSFYGWVAQSYTFNTDSPSDRINVGRVFDDRSNDYRFNQLVVNLERTLSDGSEFDLGGKVELMYGSDARFIHQRGLADNIDDNTVQFDPVQFYGLVRAPIGNGLTVKFGKYVTMLGAEVIDAPANALFSRSFLFGYAIPFTHTGIQFDYPINDNLSVYYGLVRGWDVWQDNNSSVSHMAGVYGSLAEDKLSYLINVITGPERDHENTDYRTVFDVVLTYAATENLSLSFNADYGNESGTGGAGNYWWGLAGYATYRFNPQLAATVRSEYFRDATGTRLGFTADVFEVTGGLDIHPLRSFRNLRVRPEIRWDRAFGDTPFDGGTDRDQVTLGADVILTF